ncbi:hypothetical protein Dip510_001913 [Elusimicrobium posterum]|uniref:WavE lipopolysaccharide synthesis family protein n=1 Tax=Elusimicrobium posterum TaxID=3116653 RepID=UPI003C75834A
MQTKDISVIVQGAVKESGALECIKNLRTFLPGARVILSTWEGENTDGLDYDELVLNKDPGAILMELKDGQKIYNNINRQILSVKNAFEKVKTKYILKIRTDIQLQDAAFLDYFDKFDCRRREYSIFEKRILNYYLFTPRYCFTNNTKVPVLFHPSDWMFFGLTKDIKKLFDIPLQHEPESTLYWAKHKKDINQADSWPAAIFRHSPEQYIFYTCIKKYLPQITFDTYMDISREKEKLSRQLMINNFTILDFKQWRIKMPKYQDIIGTCPVGQTSHLNWLLDYKKYCCPNYKISPAMLFSRYNKINISEVFKSQWIFLTQKFVITFFKPLYKRHVLKKYKNSPEKLKLKLQKLEKKEGKYIYVEDRFKRKN